jgi:hypothetical protein
LIENKLVFSLESLLGQTHKITYQARDARKIYDICYEHKNVISLQEADAWYVAIRCWGIPLWKLMKLDFKSWRISLIFGTFV